MHVNNLILRAYATKKDGLWVAVCIDLCLAAQGDTLEEAKEKLHSQIVDYVYDACVGEDKAYVEQLLKRKAPLSQRLTYYLASLSQASIFRVSIGNL